MLSESGLQFEERLGEAAFYGPKADFMVRDCIGRQWQLGTVQLDYNLPERFQLEYIGADNRPHQPVMIHRAPFGSLERFVGVLIEHFAGAFPLWLAPEQVRVLPLSEKTNEYAEQVQKRLSDAGLPRHDRLPQRQGAGQDPRGPVGVGPVHGGRRPARSRSRRGRLAGPHRRRPGRHAAGRRHCPPAHEVDNKTIRQVAASKFAAVDEGGGEAHEY